MVLRVFQRLQVSCAKHLLSFLVKETMRYGIAIRTMKLMIAYHHAIFEFVSLLPGVTLWRQYQLILFSFLQWQIGQENMDDNVGFNILQNI